MPTLKLTPRSYPSWKQLADCEITIRNVHDKPSKPLQQITLDDLFDAFKEKLEEDGFVRDNRW